MPKLVVVDETVWS